MITNNVLAVFAVLLIANTIIGQVIIYQAQHSTVPTGAVTKSGTVSLTVVQPPTDDDFRAYLADDDETIIVTWPNFTADMYYFFITDNISQGFDYANPDASGPALFNYTDNTAKDVQQRYYSLIVEKLGNNFTLDKVVGKFDIPIYHSTQIPGDVEVNTISFPLEPYNKSIQNIFRWSSPFDTIMTYNPLKMPNPGFDGVILAGIWFGDFDEINVTKSYWLGIVDTPYNLTIVGAVPEDPISVHIYNSTQIPGEIEINTIAYHSVYYNCNLSSILYSNVTDGDTVMTYNPEKLPNPGFDGVIYFNPTWMGQFSCLEPGKGYTFGIVGQEYDWEYDPIP